MHIVLRRLVALAAPAVAILSLPLPSSSRGLYFPGVTQSAPSCGSCHRSAPGADVGFPAIVVNLTPTARSLARGQSIQWSLSVSGGQTATTKGGFAMDASGGTFSAGANTSVQPPGRAITHANSSSRTWSFGYTAPNTPGLLELNAVVNTVNDDMIPGDEDMWAFHGFDDQATQVTPVRLFVNATGIAPLGTACSGSYRNVPVLGCATSPTIGNANFALELHSAAPAAVAGIFLGASTFPGGIDLGFVGVPTCSLYVDPLVTLFGATSIGDAQRAEGVGTFALPIPNAPELVGGILHFQAFFVDSANGRATPLTFSNALSATIQ